MSDPLSVAGSVVGIVSLGLQVAQSLYDYYDAIKGQHSDVSRTTYRLDNLLQVLDSLRSELSNRSFRTTEEDLVRSIETSIRQCEDCIRELEHEAAKFAKLPSNGFKSAAQVMGRRLAYPIRQSTLLKLEENIEDTLVHLSLALQSLQQKTINHIKGGLADVKVVLELVRASQLSGELQDWLKAPDASINFNEACRKRHQGTGLWFIESEVYAAWLKNPASFLWLRGFAGCGKSVLCSTVIQQVVRYRSCDPKIGIAFFFFTFNDKAKQDTSSMLQALVLQLSGQLDGSPDALIQLRNSYRNTTPPDYALLDCLHQLILEFQHVYIFLDALDESPRQTHRQDMLQSLESIRQWSEDRLHLLVTSRDEVDIRMELSATPEETIILKNDGIDKDIATFISQHLRSNRRLRQWESSFERIENALVGKASGVFRWVECQFQSLANCPPTDHLLEKLLGNLPENLDKTYERMLHNIPHILKEYAQRMLTVLCCAFRPLRVKELIDAIAIETGDNPGFNPKRRLKNIDALQQVCPGLVEVSTDVERSERTIHLAHFSVQEYLESERIRQNASVASFGVKKTEGHSLMTQLCLSYFLDSSISTSSYVDLIHHYPFSSYASKWPLHYHESNKSANIEAQIIQLFLDTSDAFHNWILSSHLGWRLGIGGTQRDIICVAVFLDLLPTLKQLLKEDSDYYHLMHDAVNFRSKIGSPLRIACSGSVENTEMVELLLQNGAAMNTEDCSSRTALAVASCYGHLKIVRLLLEHGADINARHPYSNTALMEASEAGHVQIVRLLLEHGAGINLACTTVGTALTKACRGGHLSIVLLLLEHGADINASYPYSDTSLMVASGAGHLQIVQLLLERGANINAGYPAIGMALTMACQGGHMEIVQLLLEQGADIDLSHLGYDTALFKASRGGHLQIVQLLLDHGADINLIGPGHHNALVAASENGHLQIVKMLLKNGVFMSAGSPIISMALIAASREGYPQLVQMFLEHGTNNEPPKVSHHIAALRAASRHGHLQVVQLLLNHGISNRTIAHLRLEEVLQKASAYGRSEIVQLLLDQGVNINACINGRTALQHAVESNDFHTLELLLRRGAAVNTCSNELGSRYSPALRSAFELGNEEFMQLLIENGAGLDLQIEDQDYALCMAVRNEQLEIVKLLVSGGADINGLDKYGTALYTASIYHHTEYVKLLLDHGADVNKYTKNFGPPLHGAVSFRRKGLKSTSVLQLLIDHGADVNAQGEEFGTPLIVAVVNKKKGRKGVEVTQLLLSNGADVHAQASKYGSALQAAVYNKRRSTKRGAFIQLLLDHGADVNAQGGMYGTALQIAVQRGDEEVARLLRAHGATESDIKPPRRVHKLFKTPAAKIDLVAGRR